MRIFPGEMFFRKAENQWKSFSQVINKVQLSNYLQKGQYRWSDVASNHCKDCDKTKVWDSKRMIKRPILKATAGAMWKLQWEFGIFFIFEREIYLEYLDADKIFTIFS